VFLPHAKPTHSEFSDAIDLTIEERQRLHRDLMRCQGFYGFMTGQGSDGSISDTAEDPAGLDRESIADAAEQFTELGIKDRQHLQPRIRQLPIVDYLDIEDKDYVDALLEVALPEDRARFRGYLSHRHLGLGIITAVS